MVRYSKADSSCRSSIRFDTLRGYSSALRLGMDINDQLVHRITKCAYEISSRYYETLYEIVKPTFDSLSDNDKSLLCSLTSQVLNNPHISARSYHDAWLQAKLDAGWKYGSEENLVAKENPAVLPYDALPATAKMEMTLYMATVTSAHTLALDVIHDL